MLNVLRVFIASPGDLQDERQIARRVVAELNRSIKVINCSVELLGWEDTPPGWGRAQSLINPDVQRCDIFVGLLWKKWGSAPDNEGIFKSGFEEEFELATTRRRKSEAPQIWMFFKDPGDISDPGSQLKLVLDFKKKLIDGKELKFKEFDKPDDFESMLRSTLTHHVLEIYQEHNAPAGSEGPITGRALSMETNPTLGIDARAIAAGAQVAAIAKGLVPNCAS